MAEASTLWMNLLQLMNALNEEIVHNNTKQGLMVTTVCVNGLKVQATLDTRATTNFLALYKVLCLGLEVTAVGSKVNTVNIASVGV